MAMRYQVKKCVNCGAINQPADDQCAQCQVPLPAQIITHDFPPVSVKIVDTSDAPSKSAWTRGPVPVYTRNDRSLQVVVTGLDIGFVDLMYLMVQLIIAAIPAMIIAVIITWVLIIVAGSVFGGVLVAIKAML
jgi:hypothetical protein